MKQKQYLGVSTHPMVCGFASKNIYKTQSDSIKILIKSKTNDELNVLHANFVNRLYEAKKIDKQDNLMLKEIEDEMLQRILKEKDNV